MLSRRTRFTWVAGIALAAACLTGARARESQLLQKDHPQRGVLEANAVQRIGLALAQRECALGQLRGFAAASAKPASKLRLDVIDPATSKPLRGFHEGDFGFCADAAGTYQLQLRAATAGGYALTLDALLPRMGASAKTAAASPRSLLSPRMRALSADPTQLEKFWTETKRAGTPLIEPGDDADSSWVTFLYRGPVAHGVSVSWPMWTYELQDTALTRLSGTDLWWKSVRFPNSARFSYQLVIDPPPLTAANAELAERARDAVTHVDPNNHTPMSVADAYSQRSTVQLSAAPPERWLEKKAPRGRVESRTLTSHKLGHTHELSVYLPVGYDKAKTRSYPLLIVFDGGTYLHDVPTPHLLDALIAADAIEPIVALFVHDDEPSQRASELPCNPSFAAFVAEELLPFARSSLRISADATQIGLAGSSFGGLASGFIALQYPDRFGKVLSQSGSYWWSFPAKHPQFDGSDKPGWLRRRYAQQPRAAIQLYLSAGTFEGAPDAWGVLDQNRLLRDTLRAQGYSVAYQEFTGGHDHLAWRATLPDGLIALFAPHH